MTDPTIIQAALQAGETFYATLNADKLSKLRAGMKSCGCKEDDCFEKALIALAYQVNAGIYNGTTETLFNIVIACIGDAFIPPVPGQNSRVDWGYADNDPSGNLAGFVFQFNKTYPQNSTSVGVDYTNAAQQKFLVARFPSTQTTFNHWYNTALNQGDIPDPVYATQTIGDYLYVYTRDFANIDPSNTITTYSKV
jgi:hypothetical protein